MSRGGRYEGCRIRLGLCGIGDGRVPGRQRPRRLGRRRRPGEGRSDHRGTQPGGRARPRRAGRRTGVTAGTLRATTDPASRWMAPTSRSICVGTPSTPSGSTDLTYIRRALHDIARGDASVVAPPASGLPQHRGPQHRPAGHRRRGGRAGLRRRCRRLARSARRCARSSCGRDRGRGLLRPALRGASGRGNAEVGPL